MTTEQSAWHHQRSEAAKGAPMNRSFWTWRVQVPILLAAILLVAFARATGSAALSIVFFVAYLGYSIAVFYSNPNRAAKRPNE